MEQQVLRRRQIVVQRGVLEHQTDAPTHLGPSLDDVETGHHGAAARRPGEGAEHRDRRGLSRPVGPEEAERLALCHLEAHPVHGPDLAVALLEILDLDGERAVAVAGHRARRRREIRGCTRRGQGKPP